MPEVAAPTATSGRLLRLGPGIALVMVAIVAIVSFGTTSTLVADFAQVRHSRTVGTDLVNLLSTLKDAETGQRGYIITGNDAYLAPYNGVQTAVSAQLDTLQALTAAEPSQQQQLTVLRPLIAAKLVELDQVLTLRRTHGFAAAASAISTDQGKVLMDQIRVVVQTMETDESAREAQQTAATYDAVRQTILTIAIGGLITVGLMALANVTIIWELRRRR
ncbi:MAG TPA: CHASE3 domain-containing protein, partial [Chloroflexota bacterium]